MGIREGILNLVSAAQLRMSGGNSKNTGGRIPGLENSRLLRLYVLPRSEKPRRGNQKWKCKNLSLK